MENKFVVIDVETANYDVSSICQIGVVKFVDGEIVDEWKTYLDPETEFNPFHTGIHGISCDHVLGAPTFPQVFERLLQFLETDILVSYTGFDLSSLQKATERYRIDFPKIKHVDAARVVRHTWDKYARDGYGLACVATDFNFRFAHHDALEDAKVAGKILCKAIEYSTIPIEQWVKKAPKTIDISRDFTPVPSVTRPGNPDGQLFGEVILFTGKLSMPRLQAAVLASEFGCDVVDRFNSRVTMLVIGELDPISLKGNSKSSKQINAENAIRNGQDVRILSEIDFLSLVSN